jgi:hypothetical protein
MLRGQKFQNFAQGMDVEAALIASAANRYRCKMTLNGRSSAEQSRFKCP